MHKQALVEDARTFQERRRFRRRDKRKITGSAHFEHFLEIEGRLLEEAGTDEGLAEAIIDQCREARKATRHGKFDAYAFNRALLQLRLAVCGVFAELQEATFDQPPPYQPSHRLASVLKGPRPAERPRKSRTRRQFPGYHHVRYHESWRTKIIYGGGASSHAIRGIGSDLITFDRFLRTFGPNVSQSMAPL